MLRTEILALDLATSCGWARLGLDGTRIDSGTWKLALKAGDPPGVRWLLFRQHLRAVLQEPVNGSPAVAAIIVERPWVARGGDDKQAGRERNAGGVALGLRSILQLEAHVRGLDIYDVSPATAKKRLTGNGRADKADMVRAALERFGGLGSHGKAREDEADALAVGVAGLELLDIDALRCGHAIEVAS